MATIGLYNFPPRELGHEPAKHEQRSLMITASVLPCHSLTMPSGPWSWLDHHFWPQGALQRLPTPPLGSNLVLVSEMAQSPQFSIWSFHLKLSIYRKMKIFQLKQMSMKSSVQELIYTNSLGRHTMHSFWNVILLLKGKPWACTVVPSTCDSLDFKTPSNIWSPLLKGL